MDMTHLPDTMDLSLCDADLLGVRSVGDCPGPLLGVAPLEGPGTFPVTCDATEAIAHLQQLRERYEISLASMALLVGCAQSTMVALLYPSSSRHRSMISARLNQQLLEAEFDLDLLEPSALIGACGTRRRLQALATLGWSAAQLADRLDCSATEISRWRSARTVSVEHALAARSAYDALAMTPGPSQQARRWALERGWSPPLAWGEENIDDPTAKADLGEEARGPRNADPDLDPVVLERIITDHDQIHGLTPLEQRAIAKHARSAGMTAAAVSDCLGVALRTVQRWDAANANATSPRKAS